MESKIIKIPEEYYLNLKACADIIFSQMTPHSDDIEVSAILDIIEKWEAGTCKECGVQTDGECIMCEKPLCADCLPEDDPDFRVCESCRIDLDYKERP